MKDSMDKIVISEKLALKVPKQYMGLVTLNRPQEMNPLNWAVLKELKAVLDSLSADVSVRAIAITGAGSAFSAGGDLKAYLELYRDDERYRNFLHDFRSILDSIGMLAQPVIALVNGYCVAGGLELLLSCDFAYAVKSAKLGDGHANFGQVGGAGGNVRFPRWILPSRARELLFTGRLLSADEALKWGLVNRVVPDDKLLEAGLEFTNTVAEKSFLGISIMKEICNRGLSMRTEDALNLEIQMNHHYCLTSHDAREGLIAFSEKRKPKFEGR